MTRTQRSILARLDKAIAALDSLRDILDEDGDWDGYDWDAVSSARSALAEKEFELESKWSS